MNPIANEIILQRYKTEAQKYSQVITSSYNGIVAINNDGEIFVFNPAAERILGRKSSEYMGKHISYLDPAMGLKETLVTGAVSFGVKTIIHGNTILTNRTPLYYNDKIVGAMGVFLDISELELVTEELNKHKTLVRELRAIIESSYDGLFICDKNGVVTRVNSAWERICGFSRHDVLGKTSHELVKEGYYNKSAAVKALETKKRCTVMLEMSSGPQKDKIIMATGTPVFDDNGETEQVVVNVRDISELENLKRQLNETTELSKRYASELEEIRLQQLKMDDIVAQGEEMKKIVELAARVAKVDSTVFITGESGVGKEVIVKKIHLLSKRKDNSLIKINCGAIPENLLESELFGYERGAFTGAKNEGKPGMFELASGGTLFLDEIGEMPLKLQVKLLRVLQEKEIVRVGGTKPIPVDVRVIAATNRNMIDLIRRGEFREDLYYRLNVVNINIPPLRNRREDIPALLHFVLKKLNEKYGENKRLTQPVVDRLLRYNWPGNVRELENIIERLVVLSDETNIQIKHLPALLQDNENNHRLVYINNLVPLKKAVEDVEIQLIENALKEYGSTRKAAKILQVNQSTIVRKAKQYKIMKTEDLTDCEILSPHQYVWKKGDYPGKSY